MGHEQDITFHWKQPMGTTTGNDSEAFVHCMLNPYDYECSKLQETLLSVKALRVLQDILLLLRLLRKGVEKRSRSLSLSLILQPACLAFLCRLGQRRR